MTPLDIVRHDINKCDWLSSNGYHATNLITWVIHMDGRLYNELPFGNCLIYVGCCILKIFANLHLHLFAINANYFGEEPLNISLNKVSTPVKWSWLPVCSCWTFSEIWEFSAQFLSNIISNKTQFLMLSAKTKKNHNSETFVFPYLIIKVKVFD